MTGDNFVWDGKSIEKYTGCCIRCGSETFGVMYREDISREGCPECGYVTVFDEAGRVSGTRKMHPLEIDWLKETAL